jgi:phosphoribosyl-AMP cyclohydrolase / phosphoribosyl-ATP pyrophosphohydrolase
MRDRSAPLTTDQVPELAWEKMGGLLPAIVQDPRSGRVLMLGYMDDQALKATLTNGFATFYSRSRKQLWQKGETSGHVLKVKTIFVDCDDDALLVLAEPEGPACHLGTRSCFGDDLVEGPGWLADLSVIIAKRASKASEQGKPSYTRRLLDQGIGRIAQKIGEEGVELSLAAVTRDAAGCSEEAADLLYHLAVLLQAKNLSWSDVIAILRERRQKSTPGE